MISKLLTLSTIFLISVCNVFAQVTDSSAQWTFMKGSALVNQSGVFAAITVSDPNNTPGARLAPYTWKDATGNLWLFGGFGYLSTASTGRNNDLWKYDITTNQWAWMGGSSTAVNAVSVYGAPLTPSTSNIPGGRQQGVTWTDASGNFWLFGGFGNGSVNNANIINDLWRYNPGTGEWTFMKGGMAINAFGTYGTQGSSAPGNTPGARRLATTWVDKNGKFWLYGGLGLGASGSSGYLNDLWKYDPAINEWTFVKGSSTTTAIGVYGVKGTPDINNIPGGCSASAAWTDTVGNLWMFGGTGRTTTSAVGALNALWKYEIATNTWIWISGDNSVSTSGNTGIYGTRGVPDVNNKPGARSGAVYWKDVKGKFWLYSGNLDGNATFGSDLWKYDPATNEWTWMRGPTTANEVRVNGTQGTVDVINTPGARNNIGGAGWVDNTGNFWLISGVIASPANNHLNDLWKLAPPCSVTANVTTARPLTFCQGDSALLIANAGSNYTYKWSNSTGIIQGATDDTFIVKASGSYTVQVTSGACTLTSSATVVTVNSLPTITISPATAVICAGKDTALTAGGGTSYTWLPTTTLNSSTGTTVIANPTTTTTYTVTGTDANSCSNTATRAVTVNTLPAITINPATATICTGKDTALTAGNGVSYTWLPSTTLNSSTGTTVIANPTTTTTYTVTGIDANGCMNTATKLVTVNTLPNITISPATPVICAGKDTALTAGNGVAYVWLPATFTGSGATIHANPTTTTTYTVTGTDANGCVSTATKLVTVDTLPVVNITGNSTLCPNGTLSLSGSPAAGTWNSGATSIATIDGSGNVTGKTGGISIVTYTATNSNNCTNSATKTITVNAAPPTPAPITGKFVVCLGDTTILTDATTGGTWSSGTTAVATINNMGKVEAIATGNTLITYTVSNVNCTNSISTTVTVNGLPPVPAAITGAASLCVGTATKLANATAGGAWSSNATTVLTIQSNSGDASGIMPGGAVVKYMVTDANGCSNFITRSVTVYDNPIVTLQPSGTIGFCDGDSTTLNAVSGTAVTYAWTKNNNETAVHTVTYTAKEQGYYSVIVTDVNGCVDTSDADTIVVHPLPNPVITRSGQVLSTGTGYISYQWYAGGQLVNNATQSSCIITQSGYYYVVVTDSNGCSKASAIDSVILGMASINSVSESVHIYPNPASSIVHIAAAMPVNVWVTGIDGKLLLQKDNVNDINVSDLSTGIYIIRIADKNGTFIRAEKLLKTAY